MIISKTFLSLVIKRHCSSSKSQHEIETIVKMYVYKRREFHNLDPPKYSTIAKSPEEMAKVERVLMEWEVIKLDTGLVPSNISRKNMQKLIHYLDEGSELSGKFLKLLETEALAKFNPRKRRKEYYRCNWTAPGDPTTLFDDTGSPNYSQRAQIHFIPFNVRTMSQLSLIPKLSELSKDSEFCQKLIIDCDNHHADNIAARYISREIMNAFWRNAYKVDPLDIHVNGVRKDSAFREALSLSQRKDFLNGLHRFSSVMSHPLSSNIHTKPVSEHYSAEKIIYITPFGGEEMISFDPQAIYVISSFIPGRDTSKRFLEKMKQTGWKSVHFPILPSLRLQPHQFNIIHVIDIISEMKQGSSVKDAIRKFISPRKPKFSGPIPMKFTESFDRVLCSKAPTR
ncbi:uncharacterized protein LOC141850528 [Brevipalpus obovatus]|uniref:uncharacterized protein LOC141850528 n=1 Tax=Brevipalpus obovatus TaxID=246614 RepID=UPI003D9EE937